MTLTEYKKLVKEHIAYLRKKDNGGRQAKVMTKNGSQLKKERKRK